MARIWGGNYCEKGSYIGREIWRSVYECKEITSRTTGKEKGWGIFYVPMSHSGKPPNSHSIKYCLSNGAKLAPD